MKILYISKFNMSDFMADVTFHGLKSLFGDDVIDYHPQWYMYDNIDKHQLLNTFHGRGFTLCGNLPFSDKIDRSNIEQKIKSKYFDLIIYGAIYRNLDLLELVVSNYEKNKIIFIDGHEILTVYDELTKKGLYFKMTMETDIKNVFPIWLAMPKEKICKTNVKKTKLIATNIPGVIQTLIFNNENEYYEDYQQSLFGYTWKKSCWESLRHCEIIMNKCVPLFIDIKYCPKQSLTKLPKNLLLDVFDVFKGFDKSILDKPFEYNNSSCVSNFNFNIFNDLEMNFDKYQELNNELYNYLCNNLTTEHIAKYIIEKTK